MPTKRRVNYLRICSYRNSLGEKLGEEKQLVNVPDDLMIQPQQFLLIARLDLA
jgi:hypothetical protein